MSSVNIGNTAAGDIPSSGDQGLNVAGLKIVVPNDGTYRLTSLSMRVVSANGFSVRLGLYDDTGTQATWPTGGAPGALKAETAAAALADGLNTINVVTPVVIPAGSYWINYQQSGDVTWTQHDTHIQGRSLFYVAPFAAFDDPFTPGSANDSAEYPIYATFDYTAPATAGGGRRQPQKREYVEIDGEYFEVESQEQAVEILTKLQETAKEEAAKAAAVPAKKKTAPKKAEIKVSPGLKSNAAVDETQAYLTELYKQAQAAYEQQVLAQQEEAARQALQDQKDEPAILRAVTDWEAQMVKEATGKKPAVDLELLKLLKAPKRVKRMPDGSFEIQDATLQ